jgi:hypothetical protein
LLNVSARSAARRGGSILKVTGGFLPLHRIKFIDAEGRVECLDGATYQAEPADLAAIMPKTAKNSKVAE